MSDRDPAERLNELEELVGRTVAEKYLVTRLIGRGGMGAVYEAENVGIGKKVALKLVDLDFARDEHVGGGFARGARPPGPLERGENVSGVDARHDDEGRAPAWG